MPACFQSLARAITTDESFSPLSIASRIVCEPDSTPIQTSAQPAVFRLATVRLAHQIGARLNLERHRRVSLANFLGKLLHPVADSARKHRRQTRCAAPRLQIFSSAHLFGHDRGGTQMKFVS